MKNAPEKNNNNNKIIICEVHTSLPSYF